MRSVHEGLGLRSSIRRCDIGRARLTIYVHSLTQSPSSRSVPHAHATVGSLQPIRRLAKAECWQDRYIAVLVNMLDSDLNAHWSALHLSVASGEPGMKGIKSDAVPTFSLPWPLSCSSRWPNERFPLICPCILGARKAPPG